MIDGFSLGPWPAGMNNVIPDNVEPTQNEPSPLRGAINVDITDEGKVRSRAGYAQVVTAGLAHSLFATPDGALAVVDGSLCYISPTLQATVLRADVGNSVMCYAAYAGNVYMTNGVVTAMYSNGKLTTWGVEVPSASPTITVSAGTLVAGDYLLACTFVRDTGEESGTNNPQVIRSLPGNNGLMLTNLPQPVAPDVVAVNIYLSAANSQTLFLVESIPVGATSTIILGSEVPGAQLRTALMNPMPAGSGVAASRGRLFVAAANTLYFSEPLRYGACDYSVDFQMFPAPIQLVVGLSTGLFIAADKTYFWGGPDSDDALRVVGEYTGVANSVTYLPNNTDAIWLSSRGIARGSLDGTVTLLTDGKLATSYAGHGGTLYRESDGIKQFIGAASQTSPTTLLASDFMGISIVRAS